MTLSDAMPTLIARPSAWKKRPDPLFSFCSSVTVSVRLKVWRGSHGEFAFLCRSRWENREKRGSSLVSYGGKGLQGKFDKSVLQLIVKLGGVDITCVPTSNPKLVKLVASKVHLNENLQFFTANLLHYAFVAVLLGK